MPDGTYRVHLVSGDPKVARALYKLDAEGTPVIDGRASATQRWLEGWADVTVADGRLTITAPKGSRGNKIDYLDIIPLSVGATAGLGVGAPAPRSAAALEASEITMELLGPSPLIRTTPRPRHG